MEIKVEIEGIAPMLHSKFSDEAVLAIENGTSKAMVGEKKTRKQQAESLLYADSKGNPIFPGPNIFAAIIAAGVFHKAGKKQVTTAKSSLVPAGIAVLEIECPMLGLDGKPAQWDIDSRSIVVDITKRRMAHRPRFDHWRIKFTLDVDDTMFSEAIVRNLVDDAGKKIGLGAFRPARKGPFGRFKVIHWTAKREQLPKAA